MSDNTRLSKLTRTLMIGVSTGTVALTQVGCAEISEVLEFDSIGSGQQQTVVAESPEAQRLCTRALQTRAAGDVEAFLRAHPNSNCVAPLINALPASTVVAVSEQAYSALPRSAWRDISRSRSMALLQAGKAPAFVNSINSSGSGSNNSGSNDNDSDY